MMIALSGFLTGYFLKRKEVRANVGKQCLIRMARVLASPVRMVQ